MKNNGLKFKLFSGSFFLLLGFFAINLASAQTAPEFMITWKALNYVPSDYAGKTLPSNLSSVEAGMDVIVRGKTIDLSKNIISWYANNNIIRSGIGLKSVKFSINSSQTVILRVVIADYNGVELSDSVLIPVQKNELAVSVKTPNNNLFRNRTILSAKSHRIEARPFFFNVPDLSGLKFFWKINNDVISGTAENPNFLILDLKSDGVPQETEINISAGASNLSNQLEIGNRTLNFIVK